MGVLPPCHSIGLFICFSHAVHEVLKICLNPCQCSVSSPLACKQFQIRAESDVTVGVYSSRCAGSGPVELLQAAEAVSSSSASLLRLVLFFFVLMLHWGKTEEIYSRSASPLEAQVVLQESVSAHNICVQVHVWVFKHSWASNSGHILHIASFNVEVVHFHVILCQTFAMINACAWSVIDHTDGKNNFLSDMLLCYFLLLFLRWS